MKLRDFGDKRPIRKPSGPQFTLTNNAAEESLKKEVFSKHSTRTR